MKCLLTTSKFWCLLSVLKSFESTGAFTTPKPFSLGTNKVINKVDTFPSNSNPFPLYQPRRTFYDANFDHSLKLWRRENKNVGDSTPSLAAIDSYVDQTLVKEEKEDVPLSTKTLIGSSLFTFTYVVQRLQIYLNTPCLNQPSGSNICTAEYYDFAKFFADHEFLSFMMILTHAIPFVLLPWVSKQISDVGPVIQKDFEGFNPFLMQMAFACIGFGLSLEFGWHVADSWYYENNFHVLNFGFYFFLISGFALWADGFRNIPIMDLVFGGILAASTALYPYGNAFQVDEIDRVPSFLMDFFSNGGASSAKIPLYVGMTATFLSITRRGREVFGNSMLWVPFFCVGVNLGFIFLLDGVQYGNAEVVDGVKQLTDQNYIYHIFHDILGTELGVLVFGLLIKNYVPLSERKEEV